MDEPGVNLLSKLALTTPMRRRIFRSVERLVKRLTDRQLLKEPKSGITEAELSNMCYLLPDILTNESICLDLSLDEPLYVVGDLRGHYVHLIHLLDKLGHPPKHRYLFLGNYTDNVEKSLETIALLFAYKVLYPHRIYLLRGKHEFAAIGRSYGLLEQCVTRFTRRLWHDITTVFRFLPVAAIVDDRVFCVHGGLSPVIEYLQISDLTHFRESLRYISARPTFLDRNSILTHFIWSDPDEDTDKWDQNPSGVGYLYGPDAVENFCDQIGFLQIIRSSDLVTSGYEFFKEPRLLTVFTAPDLCETYANNGAALQLVRVGENDVRCKIIIMKPIINLRCKQTTRVNVLFDALETNLGSKEGPVFIEVKSSTDNA